MSHKNSNYTGYQRNKGYERPRSNSFNGNRKSFGNGFKGCFGKDRRDYKKSFFDKYSYLDKGSNENEDSLDTHVESSTYISDEVSEDIANDIRVEVMYAKIHRAVVTDCKLDYVGSISIDKKLMRLSGIVSGMKVEVLNINNGERFTTYAIEAQENTGIVQINGAAARKVQSGDIVIILAFANIALKHAKKLSSKVIFVDSKNRPLESNKGIYR